MSNISIFIVEEFKGSFKIISILRQKQNPRDDMWHSGVVPFTAVQLHSTAPELRLSTSSDPACGV